MSGPISRTTTEASLTPAGQIAGEGVGDVNSNISTNSVPSESTLLPQSSLSSTGSASNSLTGTPLYCLRIRSRKGRIIASIKLAKSVMRIGSVPDKVDIRYKSHGVRPVHALLLVDSGPGALLLPFDGAPISIVQVDGSHKPVGEHGVRIPANSVFDILGSKFLLEDIANPVPEDSWGLPNAPVPKVSPASFNAELQKALSTGAESNNPSQSAQLPPQTVTPQIEVVKQEPQQRPQQQQQHELAPQPALQPSSTTPSTVIVQQQQVGTKPKPQVEQQKRIPLPTDVTINQERTVPSVASQPKKPQQTEQHRSKPVPPPSYSPPPSEGKMYLPPGYESGERSRSPPPSHSSKKSLTKGSNVIPPKKKSSGTAPSSLEQDKPVKTEKPKSEKPKSEKPKTEKPKIDSAKKDEPNTEKTTPKKPLKEETKPSANTAPNIATTTAAVPAPIGSSSTPNKRLTRSSSDLEKSMAFHEMELKQKELEETAIEHSHSSHHGSKRNSSGSASHNGDHSHKAKKSPSSKHHDVEEKMTDDDEDDSLTESPAKKRKTNNGKSSSSKKGETMMSPEPPIPMEDSTDPMDPRNARKRVRSSAADTPLYLEENVPVGRLGTRRTPMMASGTMSSSRAFSELIAKAQKGLFE